MNHDIITIGGSAGALEVLLGVIGELPADLPASIFVALHARADHHSQLPAILTRRGRLPASHPAHDEPIIAGRIYIAPPDNHLLVRPGSVQVSRGPRENGHRPAVDALFRTASTAYGSRVVGVVLSGYLDCGTAGMMSIKARGGVGVVQAPETALVSEMPASVLRRVPIDHVARPDELAALLTRLATAPAGAEDRPGAFVRALEGTEPGVPAELVCPACQGALTRAQSDVFEHFRCHIGHTFSLAGLVAAQNEELERALWAAVRALEEASALSTRVTARERGELRERFAEKAATQREHAELIKQLLLRAPVQSHADALVAPPAKATMPAMSTGSTTRSE